MPTTSTTSTRSTTSTGPTGSLTAPCPGALASARANAATGPVVGSTAGSTDGSCAPSPGALAPPFPRPPVAADFSRAPFIVIWEVTRACALACVHCRAGAVPRRDPRELTLEEGCQLIDQIPSFGAPPPLFVLTGGDPMRRPDLAALVSHAARAGLTVALTPSGTAAATPARLRALRDAGLRRIAVSLDGPDPQTHDRFRGVRGSFQWTMRIIEAARDLDLALQINTTVSRLTLPTLEAMARRVADFPIALWALFFLVQTGRGATVEQIDAEECEAVLTFLHDLSRTAPFGIKTTEAPHYHRVLRERRAAGPDTSPATNAGARAGATRAPRAPRSVGDGNGFLFIDHHGQICPSGFLPLGRGNVRQDSLVQVYREDAIFRRLRDPEALEGKCGRCPFRAICGGSRSRAYAMTGNAFASDPLCAFEPPR